jgi:hypothetical protein
MANWELSILFWKSKAPTSKRKTTKNGQKEKSTQRFRLNREL